jgi:hypothetical protein
MAIQGWHREFRGDCRPPVSYISVNSPWLAARNSASVYEPDPPGRKTAFAANSGRTRFRETNLTQSRLHVQVESHPPEISKPYGVFPE